MYQTAWDAHKYMPTANYVKVEKDFCTIKTTKKQFDTLS